MTNVQGSTVATAKKGSHQRKEKLLWPPLDERVRMRREESPTTLRFPAAAQDCSRCCQRLGVSLSKNDGWARNEGKDNERTKKSSSHWQEQAGQKRVPRFRCTLELNLTCKRKGEKLTIDFLGRHWSLLLSNPARKSHPRLSRPVCLNGQSLNRGGGRERP